MDDRAVNRDAEAKEVADRVVNSQRRKTTRSQGTKADRAKG